ncbi:hypothetical protein IWX90DRAFT_55954 [Phyllosticta citrichinensis]|uniref:Uncharacterized protein n=1 Tax=Phyllosticta citrichinensis TaxID=1130410 RepID=A0ABR1XIX1_9PEZI
MGGHAFAPSIHCPRMPPPQYAAVKAHFALRLRTLFHDVAVGTEAPEKRDYGDVDYVVSRPTGSVRTGASAQDVQGRVERALGAVRGRVIHGILFLACPMPGVACYGGGGGCGAAKKKKREGEEEVEEEKEREEFVQLDIVLCPSPSLLAYTLFTRSHGDLFSFLKTGVRPFGLSLRPSGLWVRVAADAKQQESGGKLLSANGCGGGGSDDAHRGGGNEGLLFLSSDVGAILQFLRLDKRKWDQGFERLQDVFEYAVSARWFSKRDFGGQNVRVVTEDGKGKLVSLSALPSSSVSLLPPESRTPLARLLSPPESVDVLTFSLSSLIGSAADSTCEPLLRSLQGHKTRRLERLHSLRRAPQPPQRPIHHFAIASARTSRQSQRRRHHCPQSHAERPLSRLACVQRLVIGNARRRQRNPVQRTQRR